MHTLRRARRFLSGNGRKLALPAVLCAALLTAWTAPHTGAGQDTYEALRLASEAFYEIGQKYVQPKDEAELVQGALRGMMNALDPDSSYLTAAEFKELQQGKLGAAAEAGMELVFKDHLLTAVSVLDHGPAARAGIQPGDHILKINGQLVRNLTTQEGVRRFQGAAGTTMKVQVLRNGLTKPLDLTLTLEPLAPAIIKTQVLPGPYAYVRIPYLSEDTPANLTRELTDLKRRQPDLKGIILDLRNNARGTMEQAVRTAAVLVGDREVVATRGRKGQTPQTYRGKERDAVLKPSWPMVVLVDQGTARGAEIIAGALQDHGLARLLGVKTFGLCGITKVLPLKDGSAVVMTVAHCYTPKGQKITGTGLNPDIEGIKPKTEEAARERWPVDQDPWVLQAVEVLKGGKPGPAAKKKS